MHAALWLRRLGNDGDFLGDILIGELAQRHREDALDNAYSPQVIMLAPPSSTYFIRANIWPSASEHMVRASGGDSFVLGLPHDHNFDFLDARLLRPRLLERLLRIRLWRSRRAGGGSRCHRCVTSAARGSNRAR